MAAPTARGDIRALSDSSDESGWDGNGTGIGGDQDEDEVESATFVSLLDDRTFPDARSMLQHCKDAFQFDFLAVRDRLALDFYGTVKLVNFIRHRVQKEGKPIPDQIELADIDNDSYFKPVLMDDALLFSLDDLPAPSSRRQLANGAGEAGPSLAEQNAELRDRLEQVIAQFDSYRLAVHETLDQRWGDDDAGPSSPSSATKRPMPRDDSEHYWESYAGNDIHETMLKDTVRTDAYRDFIYGNKHLFADKVVLDIGCGTGILSMFCAKAGAKQVIAVDKSAILDKARENIFFNDLGDKITCLRGRIEEVILPVPQVDVIVSEWMGYCLLYEAMLPSVIWARDKYLKPDGILVPSHATMWISPFSDPDYMTDNVTFWRDIYGFDMRAMQTGIYKDVRVLHMPESTVCGRAFPFRPLDLHKATVQDLSFNTSWQSTFNKDVESLDGFLVWFDMMFSDKRDEAIPAHLSATEWAAQGRERVAFTTGPFGKETHWRQGVLLNERHADPTSFKSGDGIAGEVSYTEAGDNKRALAIRITWTPTSDGLAKSQTWSLN